MSDLLQQREVIYTEDAERIFGPRQWRSRTEEALKDAGTENSDSSDTTTVTPPPFDQQKEQ